MIAPGYPAELRAAARDLLASGNHLEWRDERGELILAASGGQPHLQPSSCVRLQYGASHLSVALDHEQGESPLGDLRWSDYEGDARLLAWSLAHEDLLDTLAEVFGNPVTAEEFVDTRADCLWLRLDHRASTGLCVRGWLGVRAAEMESLGRMAAWSTNPAAPALFGDLGSLPLNVRIQGMPLTAETAAALRPGDVLMIGSEDDLAASLHPEPEIAGRLLGLPVQWPVQRRAELWVVADQTLLARSMDPLRPQFLLPGFVLEARALEALRPGAVLTQSAAIRGCSVGIELAGRRFGEGQVVALGHLLGVRIIQREDDHGSE